MENEKKKPDILSYRTPLMGIAALWIYIFHEWIPLAPGIPVIGFIEGFIKQIGFFGVDIFFLLSGMGLCHAIDKYSLSEFYKRRFLRVLPPYMIMAIILAFVNGWTLSVFLKNLFGIAFFAENIYALLWFVPAITVFYLLFPLYYAVFRKAGNKILFTGVMLMLWLIASLLLKEHLRFDLFGFTNRIPIFLMGILLGWIFKEREFTLPNRIWLVFLTMFIAGLVTAYYTNYKGLYLLVPVSNCCVPNFLMATSGSFLFTKGMSLLKRYGRKFGKIILTCLHFFGTISLEFYCVQELVGEKIKTLLIGKVWDSVTNVITLICVILSALALHFTCIGLQKAAKHIFTRQKKTDS